jgi:hypothetical protein
MVQYFSLTINQRTVLFSLTFQRNEHSAKYEALACTSVMHSRYGALASTSDARPAS